MRTRLALQQPRLLLKREINGIVFDVLGDRLWALNFNYGLRHGIRGSKRSAALKRNAYGLKALSPELVEVLPWLA